MAKFKIPYADISYDIPDEGVIYRQDPQQGGGQNLYIVLNGKINRITGGGSLVPNYDSLPLFTGEIGQNMTRQFGAGIVQEATPADIPNLLKATPNPVNYEQTISPTNPNASVVTRNGQVISAPAPTVSVSPLNPQNVPVNPNVAFQENVGVSPVTPQSASGIDYNANPLWLRPGESVDAYSTRVSAMNPNYKVVKPTETTGALSVSGLIKKENPSNFQQPITTPFYDTSKLPSDISVPTETLTQPQTDLQKQLETLMGFNTQAAGRTQYQNEQNAAQGVQELTRLQNDLSSQLKVSQLEAANIQAQTQTGQGVTTAIDQRQRAEALRLNSVKSLQLYAQLEMAKGNLATAKDAVDRAVQIKFDPIEAQIKALTANIDLILKSPAYTVAEKNQAAQVKAVLDAQTRAIEQQKTVVSQNQQMKMDALNAAQASGDSIIASKIIQLNPDSPDFQNNLATLTLQLRAKPTGDGTTPTSYKEWQLAGSPGTFADWLKEQNIKAPTVAQQTVAEYAARIEQANPTIEALEKKITGMNIVSFTAQTNLPAALQTSTIQQYMQAARNFINAKLRRESGAVIANSEFIEARQQYLPQPGDDSEVLAQKKANRDLVYASLKKAAGNAYQSVDELLERDASFVKIQGQDVPVGAIIENVSGQRARVNADGTVTPL